jgi:hypothetical protein
MKQHLMFLSLAVILILGTCGSALATIASIQSDLCPNPACLPGVVHPIVAGKQTSMVVKGQYVDLSTGVEISGSGVSVSYGDRVGGNGSHIVVRFNVSSSATLGERTVKLHYAIETNGPDTFKVRVVRGGSIDQIQQRIPGLIAGTTRLIAANAIPINQRVTLVFSGSRLGNARIAPRSGVSNPQTLSGCTETKCEFQLEFTQGGTLDVNLFDASVNPNPNTLLYKFFYGGDESVTISGTATSTQTGTFVTPIPTVGTATPTTFADVAPRANMLNIFRRSGNSVTVNRQTFLQVDDRWCSNLGIPTTASASQTITLPDLFWGVSNVGTAAITVAFNSQISANGVILQTQSIPASTLGLGATQDFRIPRTSSNNHITVIRFAPPVQGGCFVNPTALGFFEDPTFTVRVDVGGAVPESQTNQANNVRNY